MADVTYLDAAQAEAICRRAVYIPLSLELFVSNVVTPVRGLTLEAEDWIAGAGYRHNPYRDWWEAPREGETYQAGQARMKAEAVLPSAAPKGGSS